MALAVLGGVDGLRGALVALLERVGAARRRCYS
jgi:hypothetical protein